MRGAGYPRSRRGRWRRAGEWFTASMGCSSRIPEYREAVRPRMLRDSAHGGWWRRHLRSSSSSGRWAGFGHAGRRSRSVSHKRVQREVHITRTPALWYSSRSPPTSRASRKIITDALAGAIWFAPGKRLPHIPSLVWAAAGDEGCADVEETCAQSIPGSADEEQARLSFLVAKARSAKRSANRSAPSGVAALPPKRQSQAEFQTTILTHMEGFAGGLAALEVCGAAPIPAPCNSCPATLGMPAASRKWARPALHEARTLRWRQLIRQAACKFPIRRPCRGPCETGFSFGQARRCTLAGRRVRGGRSGDDGGHFRWRSLSSPVLSGAKKRNIPTMRKKLRE